MPRELTDDDRAKARFLFYLGGLSLGQVARALACPVSSLLPWIVTDRLAPAADRESRAGGER